MMKNPLQKKIDREMISKYLKFYQHCYLVNQIKTKTPTMSRNEAIHNTADKNKAQLKFSCIKDWSGKLYINFEKIFYSFFIFFTLFYFTILYKKYIITIFTTALIKIAIH